MKSPNPNKEVKECEQCKYGCVIRECNCGNKCHTHAPQECRGCNQLKNGEKGQHLCAKTGLLQSTPQEEKECCKCYGKSREVVSSGTGKIDGHICFCKCHNTPDTPSEYQALLDLFIKKLLQQFRQEILKELKEKIEDLPTKGYHGDTYVRGENLLKLLEEEE